MRFCIQSIGSDVSYMRQRNTSCQLSIAIHAASHLSLMQMASSILKAAAQVTGDC